MGNRWGNSGNSVRLLFFWAPKSLQMVIAAIKLKDAYYLDGEGNGTPLQYSYLENPMDGGTWWAAVYGVTQSQTLLKRLSIGLS